MNYYEGDSSWSLGMILGLPTAIAIFLICILVAVLGFRSYFRSKGYSDGGLVGVGATICALITVVLTAVLMYPWKAEYHQFVNKVGTVESISNRILGSGNGFQQKFVARYTDGRQFGCEDTRCALVKAGDELALACKRTWQYAGVDGYDCKFLQSRRAS